MDYEKKYKEALQRAKDFENGEVHYAINKGENIMHWIFPELRESEDEMIRKEMLEYCYKRMNNEFPSITIHQVERWAVWLEKQGEQKPTWSDEDEKMIRALMSICDEWATRHSYLTKEDNDIEKIKSWLKSLKERI